MTSIQIVHYAGNTFDGVTFQILENGVPVPLSGLVVRMRFWLQPGSIKLELSSPSSGITLEETDGTFSLNPLIFDLETRPYNFDFSTIDGSDVEVRAGGILVLTNSVTATEVTTYHEGGAPTMLASGEVWSGGIPPAELQALADRVTALENAPAGGSGNSYTPGGW